MATLTSKHPARSNSGAPACLLLAALPIAAIWLTRDYAEWQVMWALAFSIYAGLKWLSFSTAKEHGFISTKRAIAYLLLWPGMDATTFCNPAKSVQRPRWSEGVWAIAKFSLGIALLHWGVRLNEENNPLAPWLGMAGVTFVLHFGLFHALSIIWRGQGIDAPSIMQAPIMAASLAEFWGRRWNLAFRDLAHQWIFRNMVKLWGAAAATCSVFVISGLVHDIVISIPARGGYGLPTLYFVIQGGGILLERRLSSRCPGFRNSLWNRVFTFLFVLAPVPLLFHQPFIERVIQPMLFALQHGGI